MKWFHNLNILPISNVSYELDDENISNGVWTSKRFKDKANKELLKIGTISQFKLFELYWMEAWIKTWNLQVMN